MDFGNQCGGMDRVLEFPSRRAPFEGVFQVFRGIEGFSWKSEGDVRREDPVTIELARKTSREVTPDSTRNGTAGFSYTPRNKRATKASRVLLGGRPGSSSSRGSLSSGPSSFGSCGFDSLRSSQVFNATQDLASPRGRRDFLQVRNTRFNRHEGWGGPKLRVARTMVFA